MTGSDRSMGAVTCSCISAHYQLLPSQACLSLTHIHGCTHCICKVPLRNTIHTQNLEELLAVTLNCHPIPTASKGKLLHFKYLKSFAHEPQPIGLHSQNISHGKNINSAYFLMGLQKRLLKLCYRRKSLYFGCSLVSRNHT